MTCCPLVYLVGIASASSPNPRSLKQGKMGASCLAPRNKAFVYATELDGQDVETLLAEPFSANTYHGRVAPVQVIFDTRGS